MKRRELLTAFSSILAGFTVSSFTANAAKSNPTLALKSVNPGDLPKGDVPILTPENVFTMPDQFWKNFSGKLYIGKAGSDPTQAGNLISLYLRDAKGNVSEVQQPVALNKGSFEQFIADNAALIADPSHSMAVVDDGGQTRFNIPDVKRGSSKFSQRVAQMR